MVKRRTLSQRALQREKQRTLRRDGMQAANDGPGEVVRPATRGACAAGPRPCPWVGCRYHLFLDVTAKGALQLPHGEGVEALERMADTCAIDVADRGASQFKEIRGHFGLSDFGTRLIANKAMAVLSLRRKLAELSPCGPQGTWQAAGSQSTSYTRRAATKASLRKFFDSQPERKDPSRDR